MADSSAEALLSSVLGFARDYAGENLSIAIKTNLGPEFTVASANILGSGGGLGGSDGIKGQGGLLGLKAAVIVRDSHGRSVAHFGDAPPTEYWRLILLIVAGALVLGLAVRGLRSLR